MRPSRFHFAHDLLLGRIRRESDISGSGILINAVHAEGYSHVKLNFSE